LVSCESLVKIYKSADLEVQALQGLDLEVRRGEMMTLVGASGSGKSTLLNILAGLDAPSAGKCFVAGHDLTRLSAAERVRYRQVVIGHIWQQSGRNLLPQLTAEENVEMPQVLAGVRLHARKCRAHQLLDAVGLGELRGHKPDELSGGEQQRVSIAVALANAPLVLFADEPTGEVDSHTAGEILALLRTLNTELGLTIILVTHDAAVAGAVDRTVAIRDGRTSTEIVRRVAPVETLDALGAGTASRSQAINLSSLTHRESTLIDRVGRLQLPKEALNALPFNGRAEVRVLADHVEVWPLPTDANVEARQAPQPSETVAESHSQDD
ncbi:MAG TPA: ABC transporter ATP-binding protein, partial [Ktedonobacterales bacterium]|nr:ABC transporter ATP-binding protein [Ktedonobacterales bacterium]